MLARLYRLQIVEGDEYQQSADAALIAPRHYLPPLRGAIRDRYGEVLVSDEPAFDVTVLFGALKATDSYVADYAARIRRNEPAWADATAEQLKVEATDRLEGFYDRLAELSGEPVDDLLIRRERIVSSVDALARYIREARRSQGMDKDEADVRLREENLHHPLMRDVSPAARARIERRGRP